MTSCFVPNASLVDLGPGAQVSLFGFRACSAGQTKCCCLLKLFQQTFGPERGGPALGLLMKLSDRLGSKGHRRLEVAEPNAVRLTHDEASLLSALSAAQDDDAARACAHLTWLFARGPNEYEETLLFDLVDFFSVRGLEINTPEDGAQLSLHRPEKLRCAPSLAWVGRA